jgi:hypothetical protein
MKRTLACLAGVSFAMIACGARGNGDAIDSNPVGTAGALPDSGAAVATPHPAIGFGGSAGAGGSWGASAAAGSSGVSVGGSAGIGVGGSSGTGGVVTPPNTGGAAGVPIGCYTAVCGGAGGATGVAGRTGDGGGACDPPCDQVTAVPWTSPVSSEISSAGYAMYKLRDACVSPQPAGDRYREAVDGWCAFVETPGRTDSRSVTEIDYPGCGLRVVTLTFGTPIDAATVAPDAEVFEYVFSSATGAIIGSTVRTENMPVSCTAGAAGGPPPKTRGVFLTGSYDAYRSCAAGPAYSPCATVDGGNVYAPPDADDNCDMCSAAIGETRSLWCYCQTHTCRQTLSEAMTAGSGFMSYGVGGRWSYEERGCGLVVLVYTYGAGDGGQMIFDAATEKLVGAYSWSDLVTAPCPTPNGSGGEASGGVAVEPHFGLKAICPSATWRSLGDADAGSLLDAGAP